MFCITLLAKPKSITRRFTLRYIVVGLYRIFISYIQKIVLSAIENTISSFGCILLFYRLSTDNCQSGGNADTALLAAPLLVFARLL